jgi:lactoylglutathione lyase
MIRVLDLEASLKFYTDILGMFVKSRQDYESGRFTLVFVAYESNPDVAIELTHNWDQTEPYTHGSGFGHIALNAPDIYSICDAIKQAGGTVTREPGPMAHGTTHIAFVKDPDGYLIELVQK